MFYFSYRTSTINSTIYRKLVDLLIVLSLEFHIFHEGPQILNHNLRMIDSFQTDCNKKLKNLVFSSFLVYLIWYPSMLA